MSKSFSKRDVLKTLGWATVGASISARATAAERTRPWDIIVVGGGNAGLPLAIFASRRGARVLVIEAAGQVGGTLFLSTGQMSAAGTKFQKELGIEDTPELFYDDVMRISKGTADPDVLRLAVFNSADTADWLFQHGFKPRAGQPVLGSGHDPYSQRRYFWGEEGGISILKVLEEQLKPEIDKGNVTILTQTSVTELIQDARTKAIKGVVAQTADGTSHRYLAGAVALTTGGYCSNKEMFEQIEGVKNFGDTTYPYSQGAGIKLALSAGGYLRNKQCHQPLFNAILADDDVPSPLLTRIASDASVRVPWEIFVNADGQRFIREDNATYDQREKALARQPLERCWVVFDSAIRDASPPLIRAWSKEQFVEAFERYPLFYKSATLEGLARAAGLDASGLAATVGQYNAGQAAGRDVLGRTHMPLPIARPPYYAVRIQGYFLLGAAGIAVNKTLQVVDQDGRAIPNLFAAGEMLGFGAFQGQSYCGGMSVTPALTFGRLLGERLIPLKKA